MTTLAEAQKILDQIYSGKSPLPNLRGSQWMELDGTGGVYLDGSFDAASLRELAALLDQITEIDPKFEPEWS